jgi:hypothetical protein
MNKAEYILAYAPLLKHKPEVNPDDWYSVDENLLQILDHVIDFAANEDLPILITSIIRPKIPGVSKSTTHEDGRAFDLSVRGWTIKQIQKLVVEVNANFRSVGALSMKSKQSTAAVYEDGVSAGVGAHLHFQVRRIGNAH